MERSGTDFKVLEEVRSGGSGEQILKRSVKT